jgi:hypothetical protein
LSRRLSSKRSWCAGAYDDNGHLTTDGNP